MTKICVLLVLLVSLCWPALVASADPPRGPTPEEVATIEAHFPGWKMLSPQDKAGLREVIQRLAWTVHVQGERLDEQDDRIRNLQSTMGCI